LAIKQVAGWRPRGRYAIMPSFTFAAAAHAVLWCGLTPLLCDIDPETWLPDPRAEEALLRRYGDDIAVVIPNATFGNCLDLAHYDRLSTTFNVPVVIDGAASLGSLDADGHPFGMKCTHPLVFSLHATKTFATAEAGVIYVADPEAGASLRAMGNFGFGQPRTATMPGLNTKLSEVSALLALAKLQELETIAEHRHARYELYRTLLPGYTFQQMTGRRMAHQFVPVLIPQEHKGRVPQVVAELARQGIGAGRYFVPHLAQQPFFQTTCLTDDLSVTEAISERIVALPMSDFLTAEEVADVCDAFRQICPRQIARPAASRRALSREERMTA
jgi:dTDP-4-amino-4,6-dideoxygalactose transaminase